MKKPRLRRRLRAILRKTFRVLFKSHDSPHRIALGFSLGVFLGILPGTGPIASLVMATLLRVNKAAALIGSVLTNTWFSIVTAVLSVKIGSTILGLNWQKTLADWQVFLLDFRWKNIFQAAVFKLLLPVLTGYFIISLGLGLTVYCITLLIILRRRHETKNRTDIP